MVRVHPVLGAVLVVLAACRPEDGGVADATAPGPAGACAPAACTAAPVAAAPAAEPEPRPLHRCFPDRPVWSETVPDELLDQAHERFDQADYAGALACAEEAARQAPDSVEAHHDRALALLDLDRLDEARDAIGLAVALAPDDPVTLEAAADLYINQLSPSADHSAIGLAYARRGSRHVPRRDRPRRARLALLEGQALTDLGEAGAALRRIDAALALDGSDLEAHYARGVALFELCRFAEARPALDRVLAERPDHAHAIYQLALLDERAGDQETAARRFAEATRLDAEAFPPPTEVSPERFAGMVRAAVTALPADMQVDLARVPVETADLPLLADLTGEVPPLSPTILGLFRGLPLGRPDEGAVPQAGRGSRRERAPAGARGEPPARAIVLYRRNIQRTVRDEVELERAVARTLLHEVGHLRGEDDGSLRDRGLE